MRSARRSWWASSSTHGEVVAELVWCSGPLRPEASWMVGFALAAFPRCAETLRVRPCESTMMRAGCHSVSHSLLGNIGTSCLRARWASGPQHAQSETRTLKPLIRTTPLWTVVASCGNHCATTRYAILTTGQLWTVVVVCRQKMWRKVCVTATHPRL